MLPFGLRLEAVREPPQRLTQHKRLGSRSLPLLWDREEAPALHFKGSKPEAVPAGWSLFFLPSASLCAPPVRFGEPGSAADARPSTGPSTLQADETCIYPAIRGKCRSRDADRVIAGLAQTQHGVVARRQLLAEGIGNGAIEDRLSPKQAASDTRRRLRGGTPRARVTRGIWMAAVLACGDGAVLSHRAAGQLWQLLDWTDRSSWTSHARETSARGLESPRIDRACPPTSAGSSMGFR